MTSNSHDPVAGSNGNGANNKPPTSHKDPTFTNGQETASSPDLDLVSGLLEAAGSAEHAAQEAFKAARETLAQAIEGPPHEEQDEAPTVAPSSDRRKPHAETGTASVAVLRAMLALFVVGALVGLGHFLAEWFVHAVLGVKE